MSWKVKLFNSIFLEEEVNEFLKGRDVVDIKLSESENNTTIMVIYK